MSLRNYIQHILIAAAKSSDIFSNPHFQLSNDKSMTLFRENNIDSFKDQIQQIWNLMTSDWNSFKISRNITTDKAPNLLIFYKNIESWLYLYKFMQADHLHPHWSQY